MYHSFIIWEGTHRSCSACKFASLIFHLCLEYPKHRSANAFVSSWARNFQRQCECTHSAVEMYTLHSHSFASCLNYSLSALSGVCPSRAFCPAVAWPADAFPAFPEHFPSHAYTPNPPPPHKCYISHMPQPAGAQIKEKRAEREKIMLREKVFGSTQKWATPHVLSAGSCVCVCVLQCVCCPGHVWCVGHVYESLGPTWSEGVAWEL